MLVFSWLGMRWLGLEGLAWVLLCTESYYLCAGSFCGALWGCVGRTERAVVLTITAAALVIRALPYLAWSARETPVALALAG